MALREHGFQSFLRHKKGSGQIDSDNVFPSLPGITCNRLTRPQQAGVVYKNMDRTVTVHSRPHDALHIFRAANVASSPINLTSDTPEIAQHAVELIISTPADKNFSACAGVRRRDGSADTAAAARYESDRARQFVRNFASHNRDVIS